MKKFLFVLLMTMVAFYSTYTSTYNAEMSKWTVSVTPGIGK
ncbi:MAG: hypothetical protein ACI4EV_04820 [Lachnospiraceae bacterium]